MRIVDEFKVRSILQRIMEVMEAEGLNVAEAEEIPDMLKVGIKKNSELHDKAKQFTVHEKLFR